MGIWKHEETAPTPGVSTLTDRCVYCRRDMRVSRYVPPEEPWRNFTAAVCNTCGWWTSTRQMLSARYDARYIVHASTGHLKNLDLTCVDAPMDEVRTYLLAKYSARFSMHWRLFEETVASVFRDLGYYAFLTGRGSDGGIDVILEESGGERVGVQVKRYQDSISVEQIRAFTGALVVNGITSGVYVTTSRFQSGVEKTADCSAEAGFPIELIDAERFFAALSITQTEAVASDSAAWDYVRAPKHLVEDCPSPVGGREGWIGPNQPRPPWLPVASL